MAHNSKNRPVNSSKNDKMNESQFGEWDENVTVASNKVAHENGLVNENLVRLKNLYTIFQ